MGCLGNANVKQKGESLACQVCQVTQSGKLKGKRYRRDTSRLNVKGSDQMTNYQRQ